MTIDFANGFNPDHQLCLPGSRMTGHIVLRNPKVLAVEVIRITIYGISVTFIHRTMLGVPADFYGRGFLFQEIKNLTSSPVNLEPNLNPGHRLPFEFTMPSTTVPMPENTKNMINKWQAKGFFAGAQDMHTLPPTFSSHKKAMLGYTQSSVSYRLDATCVATKGGTSSSWLPQASRTLHFLPARAEQNPDPRLQIIKSQHQTRTGQSFTLLLHIPSVSYVGGSFPVLVACENLSPSTPVTLTSLEVQIEGHRLTRGRSLLFGEKESSESHEFSIIAAKACSISLGPEVIDLMNAGLRSGIPMNAVPTFTSFTVTQKPYVVRGSFTLRVGNEVIKGKVPDCQVEMLPGVVRSVVS
ncbi:MAG: hypothetical protein Q9169_005670 [Polycauliona sp. 2 TL-2023]